MQGQPYDPRLRRYLARAFSIDSRSSGLSQARSSSWKLVLGVKLNPGSAERRGVLVICGEDEDAVKPKMCLLGDGVGLGWKACEEGARLRGRLDRRIELAREMEVEGPAGTSSSQAPLQSSTSSSLESLMTTTSRLRARLPSSISIDNLSPIQSICGEN